MSRAGRLPFFYGWIIVALALLSAFWGTGAVQRSYPVILKPLTDDLGITRTTAVFAITVAALTAALAAPFLGHIVDRRGPRMLMVVAAGITGCTLMALSQVGSIWALLLLFGVLGLARPVFQAVGAQTTVARWFVRRRGRAITYSTLGMPLSAVVLIPLTQWLVAAFDWRTAWLILGAGVVLMVMAPAWTLMRGRPEDMGLRTDGDPPDAADASTRPTGRRSGASAEGQEWSAGAAFRTRTFWMLSMGFAIIGMVPTILTIHMFPHFTDQGIEPGLAAMANGSFGFWVIGSRIAFWGFALDRLPIRKTLVLWALLLTAAIGIMILVNGPVLAFVAAACFGLAMGGTAPLGTLTWARYYGRNSLGTITGVASLLGIVNDVAGPIMPSLVWDYTGSYRAAFAITAVACLLGIGLFALAGPPRSPDGPDVQ